MRRDIDSTEAAPPLDQTSAWQELLRHERAIEGFHLRDQFDADPERFERFHLRYSSLLLDYSKNRITHETMGKLCDLARQERLGSWIEKMFSGEAINFTEGRAVLHTALRAPERSSVVVDGKDEKPEDHRL